MLDYDKKFLLGAADNLTFDGSSIRGFTAQRESDLRLALDWGAFYWAPSDIFGPGKVLVFGEVIDKDGTPYSATCAASSRRSPIRCTMTRKAIRSTRPTRSKAFCSRASTPSAASTTGKFEFVNTGGYYHSLPGDPLRAFIDTAAEVQRAMGFQNEKDHPGVSPAQFEINYSYSEVVAAADTIQLYKLICRQVATKLGMTASFLPKPVVGVNGNGMHTNVSITKNGKNIFYDAKGEERMSKFAWAFVDRILTHGNDVCLMLNSSVNSLPPSRSAL